MTTKDIIKRMEKEFNRRVGTNKMDLYPSIRTLLESFGEEIIGEDDSEEDDYPEYTNISQADFNAERNSLRDEQRLKVKEIISSIGK